MNTSLLHRKESVIITAIEIIDDLGLQGLTTREIAKRQSISEGTLFRHFKNKAEIMLAILDNFSKYDSDIMETIKSRKLKPKEAIVYFVDAYALYYENYPAITAILHIYDSLIYDKQLKDKVKSIIDTRTSFISMIIDEGKKQGHIKAEVDTENLGYIIFGIIRSVSLKWRMETYIFSLRERILSAVNMVLNNFEIK